MSWNIGFPPRDRLVALVVRKWVAEHRGMRTYFIARDPSLHISAFGKRFSELQFEPSQTVCLGKLVVRDGAFVVLDEDGEEAGFDYLAILAWCDVPSFSLDQAAATETKLLLRKIKEKSQ